MSPLPEPRPLVFISHDRNEVALHDHVLGLANRLRREGVDARIDLYEMGPAEGWELWRERQLLSADFVIVVCTPSYRRCFEAHDPDKVGLQVRWEAWFMRRRIHDEPSFAARVLPVLLRDANADAVPELLRGLTRYVLPNGYEDLYRRITGQPAIVGAPLGTLKHRIVNLGRRSPVFEGREEQLEVTREALRRSSKLSTYTVLAGMGGIGKTRLALEHAHRCEADYDVCWWVCASDSARLQADLVRLGVELGIFAEPEDIEESVREVLAWLSSHQRWLVVYDDAEEPRTLRDLLPTPCRGHVLITSRTDAWRSTAQVLELPRLSPEAACAALVQLGGRPDDGCADKVADTLGHLPLALIQAGAYVEATGCSFRDYLELYEREGLALLDDPKATTPDDDRKTVATTWALSLAKISTPAAALLDWLAFLDPGGVPIPLLRQGTKAMPEQLRACVSSSRALNDAIAALRGFGLVERDDGVLRVHRLLQAVTREKLAAHNAQRLGAAVVQWLGTVFAYTPGETLVRDVPMGIIEQIMAASAVAACTRADAKHLARILIDVGDFHLVRGASLAAHTAYSRALKLREQCAKAKPTCTQAQRELATVFNRLGNVEARAGNLVAARHCFSRAFDVRKQLAYQDPLLLSSQVDLASSLGRLGDVALLEGDVATAAKLFVQAVDLREAFVEITFEVPQARRALALSLRKLGKAQARLRDIADARRTLRRALALVEALALLECRNPVAQRDYSLALGDLAEVLVHDGDHVQIHGLLTRSLAIAEVLAAEDPGNAQAQRDLSIGLDRLGLAEQRAGRLAEARRTMERALELRQALARANPGDAQAQHDVACSLVELMELEHRQRAMELPQAPACPSWLEDAAAAVDADAPISKELRLDLEWIEPHANQWFHAEEGSRNEVRLASPLALTNGRSRYLEAVAYAEALEWFGRSALYAGNVHAARQSLRLLTSIALVLANVDPRQIQAQRRAANALYYLGKAEREFGELENARDHFRRSAELFGSLLQLIPNDVTTRRDLAVCLSKLALVEKTVGNLERARDLLRHCRASFEVLLAEAPRDPSALHDYVLVLVRLGAIEEEAGDLEAARELYQRSLDAYLAAELEPDVTIRGEILRVLCRLAALEVRLGNLPEARELFRLLLEDDEALAQVDLQDAWAALDLVLLHAEAPQPRHALA